MGRDTARPLLLAALCAALALAAAPSGSGAATVVAEDPCGVVSLPETPMPAALDLCDVTVRTIAAGRDTDTVVAVAVRVAGDVATRPPATYEVAWTAAGCRAQLSWRDARPGDGAVVSGAARSRLRSDCSELGDARDCAYETDDAGIQCSLGGLTAIDVAAPTFEADTITWTLVVSGEVAEHIGSHRPGTVLDRVYVTSQDAVTQYNIALVCGAGTNEDCTDSVGDRMRGERPHVITSG